MKPLTARLRLTVRRGPLRFTPLQFPAHSSVTMRLAAALLIVFGLLGVFSAQARADNAVPFINQPVESDAVAGFNGNGRLDPAVGSSTPLPVSTSGVTVTLSRTGLSFGRQMSFTTSDSQAVTLTSLGNTALAISSITCTGDFTQTNTCGTSVAPGTSCTISVTFTPTAGGMRTGTIRISDNALGSPQQVSLSGTGQDFGIGFSQTTETVVAGQTAFYDLLITPLGGFNGSVDLSCSGAPQFSCVVSPASIVLANGQWPVSVSVMVSTRAETFPSGAALHHLLTPGTPVGPTKGPWLWLAALSAGALLIAARRRRLALGLALILLSVMTWVACGGTTAFFVASGPGTPGGTFTIVVIGTSGNLTHDAAATLVVRGSAGPT
jgi:ASPM-SPD-2-Hydin domain-containing protein